MTSRGGSRFGYSFHGGDEEYGMGLVRSSSFGRKRVAISSSDIMEIDCLDRGTPLKRQCSLENEKCRLEELPQDVLIKIVCGVNHDDLKRLFFVSKAIREATVIAKHSHFVFRTPKKTLGFLNAVDMEESGEFNELEQAPKRTKIPKPKLKAKNLADISVALFASDSEGEEKWPRRELFMDMDMEMESEL